jgi:spore coat polysaccharide biosynthesis protein SpsF
MYKTEQENFWANEFGTQYIERNQGEQLLASNLNFFTKALQQAGRIESCIEFGANIGMNLKALKLLYPSIRPNAIEINENAANSLGDFIGKDNVYNGSIFEYKVESKVQLSLIKGVLIHINPNMLQKVYEQLYNSSEKFILIAEYYNPTPVSLNYRGHEDRLFKRDFAGEFLDKYQDTELIDYGFSYRRDPAFPQDDITWFLIKKK